MTIARIAAWLVLLVSLVGSCAEAPYLVPIFQLLLLPPALIAIVVGLIGRRLRSCVFTIGTILALYTAYLLDDLANREFGVAMIYETYILRKPPPGFMYFEAWWQLYAITLGPFSLSVAVLAYCWPANGIARQNVNPTHCQSCGYSLHGLPEPRCPECGTPFAGDQASNTLHKAG